MNDEIRKLLIEAKSNLEDARACIRRADQHADMGKVRVVNARVSNLIHMCHINMDRVGGYLDEMVKKPDLPE